MATDLGKVGMVMKGAWSSSATYEVLDAVSYNGGLYIAKQAVPANTAPTNTTYWQAAITAESLGSSYVRKIQVQIAGNIPTTTELHDMSTAGVLTAGAMVIEFKNAYNDVSASLFINNTSSQYGAGTMFSYYNDRFYKVVNVNRSWSVTAF